MDDTGKNKSVFEYDNYRLFLRDFYQSSKIKNKKFSFRYFANKAGLKSQNFLKQVIQGIRNMSPDSIDRFAKAIGLDKEETQFFSNLVFFNQAKTSEEKQFFARKMIASRAYKKINPIKEQQFNLFSRWYYIPIRGLVSLHGFNEDPEWIAKTIVPSITPSEAKAALSELINLGLLKRDSSGRLIQSETNISTPDEVVSSSLAKTHRDFMRIAGEAIDRFGRQQRDISSVTLQITPEKAREIKEMIQKFRREIVEAAAQESSPNLIYQVNFQFFPLMEGTNKEGSSES